MEESQVYELAGGAMVLLTLSAVLYARYSRAGRARHAATRAPRTTIARSPTGTTVTLVGKVRFARNTLVSPLTGVVRDRFGTPSVDAATGYRVRLREVFIGPPRGLPLVLWPRPRE